MFKTTIEYKDFHGNKREDVFYFNMNLYETVQFAVETDNKDSFIQQLIDEKDNKRILAMFEQIVRASVGRRSDDGLRFEKSPEITNRLMQSQAWDELWMRLFRDEDFGSKFVNNVFPSPQELAGEDFSAMVEEEKRRRTSGEIENA